MTRAEAKKQRRKKRLARRRRVPKHHVREEAPVFLPRPRTLAELPEPLRLLGGEEPLRPEVLPPRQEQRLLPPPTRGPSALANILLIAAALGGSTR